MGIFDDVVVNAKSAAQTVGKMAGQFVDMSKLRINMSELPVYKVTCPHCNQEVEVPLDFLLS